VERVTDDGQLEVFRLGLKGLGARHDRPDIPRTPGGRLGRTTSTMSGSWSTAHTSENHWRSWHPDLAVMAAVAAGMGCRGPACPAERPARAR
jgi:hypothetical protein